MIGGYDVVAMGLSGVSALLCSPDESGGTPLVRPALADIVTGMLSSLAVVTAVRTAIGREKASVSRPRSSIPPSV